MITATQQGRRLVLTVDTGEDEPAIEPFVLAPLPMEIGRRMTADYVNMSLHLDKSLTPERKAEIFMLALDGGDPDTNAPHRDADGNYVTPNYDRANRTLSQAEGEELLIKALMWQTIVGKDGIDAFDEAGGGTAGALKALRLLTLRLGLLPSTTSPNSALESLTQPVVSRDTSTHPDGAQHDSALSKLPRGRRSIRQNRG